MGQPEPKAGSKAEPPQSQPPTNPNPKTRPAIPAIKDAYAYLKKAPQIPASRTKL